jgi:hypothetical protein
MSTVSVIQSNYIPWKGYFDIIHDVDLFIFYDDVQYTKNDWRNRNRIKRPSGVSWLTIPTGKDLNRLICEVTLKDPSWATTHWNIIRDSYSSAPHFKAYKQFFEHVYLGTRWESLSELNQFLIKAISRDFLGMTTVFKDSREYTPAGRKRERLLDLLKQAKADVYISGPAAEAYLGENGFDNDGIVLKFKSYSGYPEYPQLYPPFEHRVSILDLLFHTGPDAPYFIWGWRETSNVRQLAQSL